MLKVRNFIVPCLVLVVLIVAHLTGLSAYLLQLVSSVQGLPYANVWKVCLLAVLYVGSACTVVPVTMLNYLTGLTFGYPAGVFAAIFYNFLSCSVVYVIYKYLYKWLFKKQFIVPDSIAEQSLKIQFLSGKTILQIAYGCLILPFSVMVSLLVSFPNLTFRTYILGMFLGTFPSCVLYSLFGTLDWKVNPLLAISLSLFIVLSATLLPFILGQVRARAIRTQMGRIK